jgi:hypothetical protein
MDNESRDPFVSLVCRRQEQKATCAIAVSVGYRVTQDRLSLHPRFSIQSSGA